MANIDRRGFLSGLVGSVVFAGTHAFAERTTSVFTETPNLRFGVLSDVHLSVPGDEDTLLAAFEYFRDNGADAVLIAGDIADNGRIGQLLRCGYCWRKVFPGNRAPDGRHVEKLFIYGNHDVDAWAWGRKKEELEAPDLRIDGIGAGHVESAWEQAFDEKYEPIWMKTVKGYVFIGAHWPSIDDLPAFLKAHEAELRSERPFFYTQHSHPKDTCIGAWAWGRDSGASTKALSAFPNAVAFSGHSHYTLTDERSVWQGAFTSINTASLRYASTDYSLRENIERNDYGYREPRKHAMDQIDTRAGRQGMLVSVFGPTLVIERRDFVKGLPLGDNWTVPIPGGPDQTFVARKAKRSAPAFATGAEVAVKQDATTVTVNFPPARTVAKCRVFEYEVTATLVEDDVDLVMAQRRVMAPDFFLPETPEGAAGSCVFSRAELSSPGHYVFSVRPIECFGKKGTPIASETVLLPKREPPNEEPRK